jgi:microcystin-dependent protein
MAEPFLGEIEAFAFNFAPKGWALCAGQVLPINQNTALFSLLGTTYGGNGTTTFQLPDLLGRVANAFGQGQGLGNYSLGQTGGQESHTLILNEMSSGGHSHAVTAKNNGTTGGTNIPSATVGLGAGYSSPSGSPAAVNIFSSAVPTIAMGSLAPTGGQPHENRMPFLALNYCIALQGIFPSRN